MSTDKPGRYRLSGFCCIYISTKLLIDESEEQCDDQSLELLVVCETGEQAGLILYNRTGGGNKRDG